jgi:MinD-like ATPase involved in chromosome partitioning or flagellar assembly
MSDELKTIGIVSGAPQTGKTFLALYLSHILAKRGLKILLIDAGYGYLNLSKQLNLNIENKFYDFTSPINDNKITIKELGLDIISLNYHQNSISGLPLGFVQRLNRDILSLKNHYDKIIIDIGFSSDFIKIKEITNSFDSIIFVSTEEINSLQKTFSFIKDFAENIQAPNIKLIINFVQSYLNGERNFNSLKKSLYSLFKEISGTYRNN